MNHSDDIHEELEDSPLLRSFKRREPFEVPEGYFEQLSSQVQEKIEDEAALQDAPRLQKAGKGNVFLVPEGYFRILPKRVMDKVSQKGEVRSMRRSFMSSYSWAVAAAIALLVAAFWGFGKKEVSNSSEELAWDESIKEEQLYEALALAGVDSYDLMAALNDHEEFEVDEWEDDESIPSFSEDEILNQLEMGELEDLILDM